MERNYRMLKQIYDEQIYLLDLGVSLDYSDSLSQSQRGELIEYSTEAREALKTGQDRGCCFSMQFLLSEKGLPVPMQAKAGRYLRTE